MLVIKFAGASAPRETCCFLGYYTASRLALLGEAKGNLQDLEWFRRQTLLYASRANDIYFGNPPSAALTLLPLARLPHRQARILWTWLTLFFWGGGIALLGFSMVRYAGGSPVAAAPALLCLAVLFAPLRANLEVAHLYGFIFLLQSLSCWLWLRGQPAAAGAIAGTFLALKGFGVPLIALAILRREWRFVGAAAASLGTLAFLAGTMLGFRQWTYFFEAHTTDKLSGISTPAYQTLKSLLIPALHLPVVQSGRYQTLTPTADRVLFTVETVLTAALLFWLSEFALLRKRIPRPPTPATLSICVLVNLVLSPYAEHYAYTLVMTSVLLMIPALRRFGLATVALIIGGILVSWPFHLNDRTVMTAWNWLSDYPLVWGAILLLAASIALEYRHRHHAGPAPKTWRGAYVACAAGIVVTLWFAKPFRDPVRQGPLLAIGRSDASSVTLLRLDLEEREVATIPLSCKGPSSLAFTPDRNFLYAACTDGSGISVIGLGNRRERIRLPARGFVQSVRRWDGTEETWVSDPDAGEVRINRTGTATFLGAVATGVRPWDIVFADQGRRAWVSNEASDTVSLVDGERRQKIRDIPTGSGPRGMALTSDSRTLLVTNFRSNTISVFDTASSRELAQVPVCQGPTALVTVSRGRREFAYVTCFKEGSVGVLDIEQHEQIQNIEVGNKPSDVAASRDDKRVYVSVRGSNRIVVLETGSPSRILRRLDVGPDPTQIAIAPVY
jgi:YVTN family beta-propeller protein